MQNNADYNFKNLFVAGTVGVGKTTLIKETVLPYAEEVGGFYTEEIKKNGKRQGFLLKTFDGKEGTFAWKGRKNRTKFGKYGIDLEILESIGVHAMHEALHSKKIVIIDEIGSMEMLSSAFHDILMQCIFSQKYVLATIRFKSQPFSADLERLPSERTLHLSRENFHEVKLYIQNWIRQCLKK